MPVLEASYRIVWNLAEEKKPLITETLVILCAMEVAKQICGKDADLNTAQILLSNCILWLPEDTQKQVVEQKKKSLNIRLQFVYNIPIVHVHAWEQCQRRVSMFWTAEMNNKMDSSRLCIYAEWLCLCPMHILGFHKTSLYW
jgi:hypothetical protein